MGQGESVLVVYSIFCSRVSGKAGFNHDRDEALDK